MRSRVIRMVGREGSEASRVRREEEDLRACEHGTWYVVRAHAYTPMAMAMPIPVDAHTCDANGCVRRAVANTDLPGAV